MTHRFPTPLRLIAFGLIAAMPLAFAPAAHAAWPYNPWTGGVPVSTAAGHQDGAVAVSDGVGGMIVAWQDERAGNSDIYVQRIDAAGVPRWTAGGLAVCVSAGEQYEPVIESDGAGGAIVAWTDGRGATTNIFAQRVNAAGAVQWAANGVSLCTAAGNRYSPAMASDGANGAIVAWEDARVPQSDIYAQRIGPTGALQWVATGVAVSAATGFQAAPDIASDGAGGAIVAWHDLRGATYDIYAQRLASTGAVQWTANGAPACVTGGDQTDARIVGNGQAGAILAWDDARAGATNYDVYAQQLSASGAALWGATGLGVCTLTGNQFDPRLAPDGMGGAWFVWADARSGSGYDVGYQHLYTSGLAALAANGPLLVNATGDQNSTRIVADGVGGIVAVWQDSRSGVATDLYGKRVGPNGELPWESNGELLCGAALAQRQVALASDAASGALVAWSDFRAASGSADLYAQHLDLNGALGDAAPRITSVRDVANDQGGQVRLVFQPSYLEAFAPSPYRQYRVWRSVPPQVLAQQAKTPALRLTRDPHEAIARGIWLAGAAPDVAWEPIDFWINTNANLAEYSVVVPTTSDSIAGSNPRTKFMVGMLDYDNANKYWFSAPDSGYSVDNVGPAAPAAFAATWNEGEARLAWDANTEADLAGYRLYRGASLDFATDASSLVSELTEPGHVDLTGAGAVYKLTAVDVHGNESPAAIVSRAGAQPSPAAPAALAFAAPSPNPAQGQTRLRWTTPGATRVRVSLFDAAGRRVRVLHDAVSPAGEHSVTFDLHDDAGRALPGGLYLARLEAAGEARTRRLLVLP